MFGRKTACPYYPTPKFSGTSSSELKCTSALKLMLEYNSKDHVDLAVEATITALLDKVEEYLTIENAEEPIRNILSTFYFLLSKKDTYHSDCALEPTLKTFYERNVIKKNFSDNVKLCCETISQSRCKKWFEERRLRITASKNVHSIKSRRTKTIESLVLEMLNPKSVKTEATEYGIANEPKARKLYEQLYECKVVQVGLIAAKNNPWLCVSLDGVVIKNQMLVKIVEFKCPSSCRNIPIVDFVKKKSNVHCLEFQENSVILRKSDPYYTQCQVQMYATGMDVCDLFLYSPVQYGSINIKVLRNEVFISEAIPKAEIFYLKHYLPALVASIDGKRSQNFNLINTPKRYFCGKDITNYVKKN